MIGLYNTNYNNNYLNQNYSYQQPVMYNNYSQQQSLFGGYGVQQQNSWGNNSQSSSLISMMMMLMQALMGQNTSSVGNAYSYPGVNVVNNGNIGGINISNLFAGLLGNGTTTVDQTQVTVEEKPHKVAIIGSYKNSHFGDYDYNSDNKGESSDGVEVTLGRTIQDFSGVASGNGARWDYRAHDKDSSNNQELNDLYSKLSDADKNLKFDKGQAYIIDTTTGKVLGTVANTQVGKVRDSLKADGSLTKSTFEILNSLGIEDNGESTSAKNSEEASGGKIKFNGITYDVDTTVLRKNTPLTFDLNGDGVKTSDKVVDYDINGDGKLDKINDVADGTLCIRGGKDGKDLFGDNTDLNGDGLKDGFKDGFAALKALAKKEGLIDGKEDMILDAKDIKILEEKYDFGMKTDGYNSEAKSLADLGITEINLGSTDETKRTNDFDGQGNDILKQEGATFKIDGQEREYADVLNAIKG